MNFNNHSAFTSCEFDPNCPQIPPGCAKLFAIGNEDTPRYSPMPESPIFKQCSPDPDGPFTPKVFGQLDSPHPGIPYLLGEKIVPDHTKPFGSEYFGQNKLCPYPVSGPFFSDPGSLFVPNPLATEPANRFLPVNSCTDHWVFQ